MIDLTPDHLKCDPGFSCPSVHELTPEAHACTYGPSCSSVSGLDNGDLVLVGKIAAGLATTLRREDGRMLSDTIGPDETAIVIPRDLLDDFVRLRIKELGCQADAADKGEAVSPSALQTGADADAARIAKLNWQIAQLKVALKPWAVQPLSTEMDFHKTRPFSLAGYDDNVRLARELIGQKSLDDEPEMA